MNLLNYKLFDNNQTHLTLKAYTALSIEPIDTKRHFIVMSLCRTRAIIINWLIINIPRIVSKRPRIISKHPRVVSTKPRIISNNPREVSKGPLTVSNNPLVASKRPRIISNDPRIINNNPWIVNRKPRIVSRVPCMIKEELFSSMDVAWPGCGTHNMDDSGPMRKNKKTTNINTLKILLS